MTEKHPTLVLGATGYVGGELLRLIVTHPKLELAAAFSESQENVPVGDVFPHLQPVFREERFEPLSTLKDHIKRAEAPLVVFSAAAHGASAAKVAELLSIAKEAKVPVHVADLSADFRYATPDAYETVYGQPHAAPELLSRFTCELPEHTSQVPEHVGHPGCFTTAMLLAIVPMLKLSLVEPDLFASGITGSTGSGQAPKPTTHHPLRQSNLFSYKALDHRHLPEMTGLAEKASGVRPSIHFVPHSGPFARGIHMTVQAKLKGNVDRQTLLGAFRDFYREAPFVRVVDDTPMVKNVVGSNYAQIGLASDGETIAVFSVIDNLLKGAAGGAVQWVNRMIGVEETAGLTSAGPGWV